MTTHSSTVVLCLVQNTLRAWEVAPAMPARLLLLHGETCITVKDSDEKLCSAWHDLMARLHDEGCLPSHAHWLLDNAGKTQWLNAVRHDSTLIQPSWQVLEWEWLATRFGLAANAYQQVEDEVLPWLMSMSTVSEQQQQKRALVRAHEDEATRLAAERQQLQQANERLRAQNTALQRVDAEHLLSYLPALYPRVFTHLGAVDLAALCGKLEPFDIPNPYPEPSTETLVTLQKRFRSLPRDWQLQVVRFMASLPQRQKLSPRPEMRALVSELEEEC